MAFNPSKSSSKETKDQFTAVIHSVKSDKGITFVNLTQEFVKNVFGVRNREEVTAEQAEEVLPTLLGNDKVYVKIYDLTAEHKTIAVEDY